MSKDSFSPSCLSLELSIMALVAAAMFINALLVAAAADSLPSLAGCYTSMFAFGDSMTDTGNYLTYEVGTFTHVGVLPYGETFFHHPTGRYSDGRIIIDFLAEAFGLPLLPPYLAGPGEHGFRQGANFAFAGATALDPEFFLERGEEQVFTNYSLRVQTQWFKELLPSLCSSQQDCENYLKKTLFVVGEIGGNDYNHPLKDLMPFDEVKTFTPKVVHAIISSLQELIELGARTLVVPGSYPLGCMPTHLTEFATPNSNDYDTGCIKRFNKIAEFHNRYLQKELQRVISINPEVSIIYADYYGSTMNILRTPSKYGFYDMSTPMACCGGGGPYNYNPSVDCGCEGSSACSDPSKYVYWDGYHLTEAANRIIAYSVLLGPNGLPPLASTCVSPISSA